MAALVLHLLTALPPAEVAPEAPRVAAESSAPIVAPREPAEATRSPLRILSIQEVELTTCGR